MVAIHERLGASQEQIEDFCRRWNVRELALFGSVVREDFSDVSDIDVMVTFHSGTRRSPFDVLYMKQELEEMFGLRVTSSGRARLRTRFGGPLSSAT